MQQSCTCQQSSRKKVYHSDLELQPVLEERNQVLGRAMQYPVNFIHPRRPYKFSHHSPQAHKHVLLSPVIQRIYIAAKRTGIQEK